MSEAPRPQPLNSTKSRFRIQADIRKYHFDDMFYAIFEGMIGRLATAIGQPLQLDSTDCSSSAAAMTCLGGWTLGEKRCRQVRGGAEGAVLPAGSTTIHMLSLVGRRSSHPKRTTARPLSPQRRRRVSGVK